MNTKLKLIFPSRVVVLTISSVLAALGIWVGIVYSQGSPLTPFINPGTNFQVCTGGVNQDACYNPSSSITRLNWTYSSTAYGQMAFWVQADNNGNLDGNFPSPEINTGWRNSSNQYYDILPGSLQSNTTYYWKMAVADTHGSWSGWTCADTSFTTPAPCNNPPSATNLQVVKGDYCSSPAHYFSWTYSDPDGHNQSQFQFQVDNNTDFASPEVNRTFPGLNNPSPTTNNQSVTVAISPGADQLGYNSNYYWRVRVWDSQGGASDWFVYQNNVLPSESFGTPIHAYPSPQFTPSPQNPAIAEVVIFFDTSKCYSLPGNTEYICSAGGATISYLWDFDNGQTSTTKGNATTTYTATGLKTVRLTITDNSFTPAGICYTTRQVNTSLPLPAWIEIAPF